MRRIFALAIRQIVLRLAHDEARSERGMDVDAVGEHGVDRPGQLLVGGVLDDVPLGAELERLAGVGRLVLHREDDDSGAACPQVGDRVEARAVAQGQVEDDDVGAQPPGLVEGLAHPRRLADDFHAAGRLQHAPDAAANDLVIVHEEDADHASSTARLEANARPAARRALELDAPADHAGPLDHALDPVAQGARAESTGHRPRP